MSNGVKDKNSTDNKGLTALNQAFVEHAEQLKSFLKKFFHRSQDIDDIAQEAYIRAYKTAQRNEVEYPKTLLFTIAKNIALNELRSKARKITVYIEECQSSTEDYDDSIEEQMEAFDALRDYCEAVDALPEQCRRVYLLRKVHGLTHQKIADYLGVTVRTVERHLQKGVLMCREHMNNKDKNERLNKAEKRHPVGATKQMKGL